MRYRLLSEVMLSLYWIQWKDPFTMRVTLLMMCRISLGCLTLLHFWTDWRIGTEA